MSNVLIQQAVSIAAALLLLISFALLAQHRMLAVLHWFAAQGVVLAATAALVAYSADKHELYISAVLALVLKGFVLPWLLWRAIKKLKVHREVEPLVNLPLTMLIAVGLVIFSYHISVPVQHLSQLITRNTLAIATACVLLGILMMITRKKAITQVIGFLAVENSLFFAAIGATYGMPMIVEIGIAFDVLVAALIFGLFFFHIRSTFDSLDLDRLHLREGE